MPSLQVRELPEHIYTTLCREAEAEHRSLAQQAVATLERGLSSELEPRGRRRRILDAISNDADGLAGRAFPDPAKLVRSDRDR